MNGVKLQGGQCLKDFGVSMGRNLNSPGNAKMQQVKTIEWWGL